MADSLHGRDTQATPDEEIPDDGMRKVPTDPPEVVPAISSEQLGIAAALGLSGFAQQNPEGGFVGDEDIAWKRDLTTEDEEPETRGTTD